MTKKAPTLTVFLLAMINLAAVCNLKNWPFTAQYGLSSISLIVISVLAFLLPVAFVAAELATGWPEEGGIFAWVKRAFGHRAGFLAIWLLWIENVFWYPTALSFISTALAYTFNPKLALNPWFNLIVIWIIFWGATIVNLLKIRISGWISAISVNLGTIIPGLFIIILAVLWFLQGKPLEMELSLNALIPHFNAGTTPLSTLVVLTGIFLSFAGLEMSAVHAKDVINPQRNYPKALFISGLFIAIFSILGTMAIGMVVPSNEISLLAGSMQAFWAFLRPYGLDQYVPVIAILVTIGAIGAVTTWVIGPSRGLLAAAKFGDFPPFFRKVNKDGQPVRFLVSQAIIVSLLSSLFVIMPSLNSAYWIMIVIAAQLYLIMYIMMFASAVRLRYTHPLTKRVFKIPGKNWGIIVIAMIGSIASVIALSLGFVLPSDLHEHYTQSNYAIAIAIGMLFLTTLPFIILLFQKPSWKIRLQHEQE